MVDIILFEYICLPVYIFLRVEISSSQFRRALKCALSLTTLEYLVSCIYKSIVVRIFPFFTCFCFVAKW